MINCTCIVQAGQSPDRCKEDICRQLSQFTEASFGEAATIAWIPVPAGSGFTAGQPSKASVVSIASNEPLHPARRESLLRELVASWTATTVCSVDDIVAVIADPIRS